MKAFFNQLGGSSCIGPNVFSHSTAVRYAQIHISEKYASEFCNVRSTNEARGSKHKSSKRRNAEDTFLIKKQKKERKESKENEIALKAWEGDCKSPNVFWMMIIHQFILYQNVDKIHLKITAQKLSSFLIWKIVHNMYLPLRDFTFRM